MTRKSAIHRKTNETDVALSLELENSSEKASKIDTPIPFFNHMLDVFSRHGGFYMELTVRGDVDVDLHHTIEDTGIVLGDAFKEALGDKKGIARYGSMFLPMDEALTRAVVDLSGRSFYRCDLKRSSGSIGQFDLDNCKHFFRSVTDHVQMNCHIELLYGEDTHHIIESVFKAMARALRQAVRVTGKEIPSTKGKL